MTEVSTTVLIIWAIYTIVASGGWIMNVLRYQDISKVLSDVTYHKTNKMVAPWHYALYYVMQYRYARATAVGYRNALFYLWQSAVMRDETIPKMFPKYLEYLVQEGTIPNPEELPPLIMATEKQCKDDAERFKKSLRDNGINPD